MEEPWRQRGEYKPDQQDYINSNRNAHNHSFRVGVSRGITANLNEEITLMHVPKTEIQRYIGYIESKYKSVVSNRYRDAGKRPHQDSTSLEVSTWPEMIFWWTSSAESWNIWDEDGDTCHHHHHH